MRLLSALLLVCFCFTGIGQTKQINYLKTKVDAAKTNDEKLAAIVAYCEDFLNINQDSLEKYAYIALDLAANSKDLRLKSLAQLTLAQDYMKWGWTDSVHVTVENELKKEFVNEVKQRDIYIRLNELNAFAYAADGRYQESLSLLYKLEEMAQQMNDSLLLASTSDMVGKIAISRKELKEARKWNDKALAYSSGNKIKYLGSVLINRGRLMYLLNKNDSSLYFLNKGIEFCKQYEMFDKLARGYRYQSEVYTKTHDLDKAETALKNMQAARGKMYSSPDAIIDDNLQIANFYAKTGQLDRAIAFCWSKLDSGDFYHKDPGVQTKTFNTDPATRLPFYQALSGYLKDAGDWKSYQYVLEEIIRLKDTLYKINKAEAIAELQTKYNVEQKEKTIIEQDLKLERKNYLIYGSLLLIAFFTIIVWMWIRSERIKQKARMHQAIEEEKRQAAQSILDAEEKERKRIAADLHDNIGAYASAISADVENIAIKGLTDNKKELKVLEMHSKEIIYSLRDTIWVLNKENITITEISDRVKSYIHKLCTSYEHIDISVDESIENDVYVGSQRALNLFRIVQEAVHNALKHSGAKNIVVEITSNSSILVNIKDDGKGIGDANGGGNGLRNMQSRANDAGLIFSVISTGNNGTCISLEAKTS